MVASSCSGHFMASWDVCGALVVVVVEEEEEEEAL